MRAREQMAVPEGRIFLINSMGELHNINHTYRQTYLSLSRQVDLTFPPLPHDGADDAFDGHDPDEDGEGDGGGVAGAMVGFDGHLGGGGGGGGGGKNGSGVVAGLTPESSSSSAVAAAMVPPSSVSAAAGGGGGDAGGANDGADEARITGAAAASMNGINVPGSAGISQPLGGGGVGGSTSSTSSSIRAPVAAPAADPSSTAAVAVASKTATTVSVPRRWEEVAPRREKSFYPNRAAVEDRFTDLNFWRDPPALIGDDDDVDDDDDDDDDDSDSQDDEGDGLDGQNGGKVGAGKEGADAGSSTGPER